MAKTEHELRDPIHGFIRFSSHERSLLNARPLQRLRHIHQLALTSRLEAAIQKVANEIGAAQVAELEQLATALYFTKQDPKGAHRVEAIVDVKPHISRAEAATAVNRIDLLLPS